MPSKPRPTVPLVRSDLWNEERMAEPARRRRRSQLLERYVDGKATDAEASQAQAILAEIWGERS